MASNTTDASGLVERLRILLPPAADVDQRYLDGWCEGQAYLIANHCSDEQFDEAITATDHITTLTARVAEQDAEIARLKGVARFARHNASCPSFAMPPGNTRCTCGLTAARALEAKP